RQNAAILLALGDHLDERVATELQITRVEQPRRAGLGDAFGDDGELDLAELAMASVVCIGGPASAAALASAKEWRDLLIPGVLAGSFGYATGSFIGVTIVEWLQ
ncbi:MAG: DUF819 family protein, partial [Paracoccaceae bacterium]